MTHLAVWTCMCCSFVHSHSDCVSSLSGFCCCSSLLYSCSVWKHQLLQQLLYHPDNVLSLLKKDTLLIHRHSFSLSLLPFLSLSHSLSLDLSLKFCHVIRCRKPTNLSEQCCHFKRHSEHFFPPLNGCIERQMHTRVHALYSTALQMHWHTKGFKFEIIHSEKSHERNRHKDFG